MTLKYREYLSLAHNMQTFWLQHPLHNKFGGNSALSCHDASLASLFGHRSVCGHAVHSGSHHLTR